MAADDWARRAATAPPPMPAGELAAVLARAASIGVPAWRVTTALGLPAPTAASDPNATAR